MMRTGCRRTGAWAGQDRRGARVTPHQFAQKVAALQACAPGVQWLEENGIVDFRTGWRRCEQADFMT